MMSVADELDLEADGDGLLKLAEGRWVGWVEQDPRLARVSSLAGLRRWLAAAEPGDADEVLLALATLGSCTGGDDLAAAAALAWALVPGGCSLAGQLRTLSPRIDELVAGQLWVQIRTFPWDRSRRVAANILATTRTAVLADCGSPNQLRRVDRTWSETQALDPFGPFWAVTVATHPACAESSAAELLRVLDWACETQVIDEAERVLLLSLVDAADRFTPSRTRTGQGLFANNASREVADRLGISPVTVRRRARRSLQALAAARVDLYAAAQDDIAA